VAIGGIAFGEDPPAPRKETGFQPQGLVHRISYGKPESMPSEGHSRQWSPNLITNFKRAMAKIQSNFKSWGKHSLAFHLKLRQMPLQLGKPRAIHK
jgi:hypothetical protein